jgi:hypothetical protein
MNEVEILALGDALAGRRCWYAPMNASHSATTSNASWGARGRSPPCSGAARPSRSRWMAGWSTGPVPRYR